MINVSSMKGRARDLYTNKYRSLAELNAMFRFIHIFTNTYEVTMQVKHDAYVGKS